MLTGLKDWLNDFWDRLNEDIVKGATPEIRNKQREKIADFLFDIAKFLITGLAFGTVVGLAIQPGIDLVLLVLLGAAALFFGLFCAYGGVRELSLMERPSP